MPFSIRPYQCFPVGCSETYHARQFLRLPLAYFLGFWLVITFLLLSREPACAEWMLVSELDRAGVTIYVDSNTIRRKGDRVQIWELIDYRTKQTVAGTSYLSARLQREYDCIGEVHRTLVLEELSGNMGTGTVLRVNSDPQKWEPIDPGSIAKRLWKVTCNKK